MVVRRFETAGANTAIHLYNYNYGIDNFFFLIHISNFNTNENDFIFILYRYLKLYNIILCKRRKI